MLHLLDHAGVDARVFNENAQGGLGEIPFTHAYPEVWLTDEADLERAQAVITKYERSSSEGNVPCGECREENPANFQVCWNCGEPLH